VSGLQPKQEELRGQRTMADDHAGIPTKRVELGESLTLDIPADWTYGHLKDGRWWCGDAAKTIIAYLGVEIFSERSDLSAEAPTDNVTRYVADIVALLRSAGFSDDIAVEPIQSGRVVHAVAGYHDYQHPYREYRWYTHNGRNDYVDRLRISLVVQMDAWDEPRLRPIVNHFAAEAFAFDPAVTFLGQEAYSSLKDHTVEGLFAWRIPDRWRWDIVTHGRHFHDLADRPGRLLMAHRFITLHPEHTDGQIPGLARIIAEGRIAGPVDGERRRIAARVIDAPLGAIGRIDDDELEPPAEEELIDRLYVRHHQWFYLIVGKQQVLEIFFNLTVPLRKLGEDGIEQLVALVEREIMALRLDPKLEL
jgi:hypothetical protein